MLGGRADSLPSAGYNDTNSDSGFNSGPQNEGSGNDSSRNISGIDDLDDEIPF
jgi:single-stranded DNA-binding protein